MAPIDDETLDRLLTRSVSAQLDGHLGRAEAAFRQQWAESSAGTAPLRLADTESASVNPAPRQMQFEPRESRWDRWRNNTRWFAGIAGTALAASVATLMLLPHIWSTNVPPQKPGSASDPTPNQLNVRGTTPVATSEHPVERSLYNRAWDEGTATDEAGRPLRRVRYQQIERYRYYDPQRKATVEWVVPREDVEHYKLDTY